MTTTTAKTPIKATWAPSKVQEETTRVVAAHCLAAFQTLGKYGPEAIKEFQNAARQFRVDHLKSQGVKNPIDLARAMAEAEANLFGSQIEVSGDENSATLTYKYCGMWEAIKKLAKMSPEQEKEMGSGFQACMQGLANEFNLNANVQFEGDICTVSFKK